MRRFFTPLLLVLVALVFVSCDRGTDIGPTSPIRPTTPSLALTPGQCTTISSLTSLVNTVFGPGSPNVRSALGKLDNIEKQVNKGNIATAQSHARDLVSFILAKVQQGGLPGTPAQVQALVNGILCYTGIATNSFVIYPTDQPQILLSTDGSAGISLQGNTVAVPTVVTITVLPSTTSPLITKLDQYPGYVALTQTSVLTKPAIVAVCPSSSVPLSVVGRLRLGHQAVNGFEITPPADGSFLNCNGSTASAPTGVRGLLASIVSLVSPKSLYAATFFGGGVAGLATEFSPFGPVDPELSFRGGVSGTLTEFKTGPSRGARNGLPTLEEPGAGSMTVVNGHCTAIDAPANGAVQPECRPGVNLQTAKGTILTNVPVSWAVTAGGGTIAPEASGTRACGTFASTASTFTNVNGNAGICWILGPTPGTNTSVATPTAGGDAPAGVTFSPASITFNATAFNITPTASAVGGSFVYDQLPHAGSGSCSNGLTPSVTYSGNGSTPVDAGSYTLTVTCGAGVPGFNTATSTATISITRAPTVTTLNCPQYVIWGAPNPCTANVTGPGLNMNLVVTYLEVTGGLTATASYAGDANRLPSQGSALMVKP
jgi:hypothetical protein